MTTLAVRDGVVAFDSRITSGDGIVPNSIKKAWISTKHPVIYAVMGTISNVYAAAQKLDRMRKLPWDDPDKWDASKLPSMADSSIFVVCKDGRVFCIEEGGWWPAAGPYWAGGSGAMAATAAMHMGADAAKAVEIAILVDQNSGGPVNVLRLDDIKVVKRKPKKRAK
ncbi:MULTISPECIES: hypothetical protein [unclassified Beijerinckia]|uniref:hypothetical protein n=1 Tax=unclassified Beijerinckia TaxID=2638183 RepID=UPI00089AFD5E|nr:MULTISPECIES: hypothetical protein [unclassified Beijerinckia]MDH7796454.1 ATP-dependent protease HslVU (ClpYQ) peptidase subunit [Beijerinckia sp. GAS462]SEC45783.1 hypothetical protein SAMN05443249_2736 [Beijerinckia sp. 28-YEA-48]